MAILLAYLFYFVAATIYPLQRRHVAVKTKAPASSQIHFAFLVTGIIAILGWLLVFVEPMRLSSDHVQVVVLTFTCAVAGAAFLCANFIAQPHVEAGVSSVVGNIYTPIAIMLASLFLNETLEPVQMLGAALLLIGIVLVAKQHRTGSFRFDKYFLLMLLGGVFLGVLLTAERALQVETGLTTATLLSWWSQFIALGIIVLITKASGKHPLKDIGLTGGLLFLQALSWVLLVYIVGNLSVVSAVTTFKVVLIFIAAAVFLREREDLPRKVFGSIIALAGLLLM